MFWNTEFLDSAPSHIDVVLQMQTVKLSDILFEDDLLQELKTSNLNLDNFLTRPEIIAELIDNITQLTEKDCCDKSLYSNVHAAYISCEILTGGSSEIFAAFMNHPESLRKIISCLIIEPIQLDRYQQTNQEQLDHQQPQQQQNQSQNENESQAEIKTVPETETEPETKKENSTGTEKKEIENEIKTDNEVETNNDINLGSEKETENESKTETEAETEAEAENENENEIEMTQQQLKDEIRASWKRVYPTKVVPQKATLVSKLLSTIHTLAPAKLSCHITQTHSFIELVHLLIRHIDVSGAFEILSTFIKRTEPPELRYIFCETLYRLSLVENLINEMTLSDIEDKQRNACQLLCDIIVIGRQDASEQTSGPKAQDMLSEFLESNYAARMMLEQMFMRNSTAIVCGMKVLQTLLENKLTADQQNVQQQNGTIEKIQEEIEEYLIKFHELLLNPPKQQPIKTTFGVIQIPLGYMRLEVVNLIRALISTNSPNIIRKLVELKTMKVIIDLFIEYSWNNLLHTQVEQALCLIINNCRKDEEEFTLSELFAQCNQFNKHQGEAWKHSQIDNEMVAKDEFVITNERQQNQESQEHEQQAQQVLEEQVKMENGELILDESSKQEFQLQEEPESQANIQQLENSEKPKQSDNPTHIEQLEQSKQPEQLQLEQPQQHSDSTQPQPEHLQNNQSPQMRQERSVTEIPSVALLSQLLNECDLIGRLLMSSSSLTNEINLDYQRRRNGEQANFGHIIQMINSIAINRDLDTIREHLNEMKEKRAELYDRWTTFVNVDVASFKEISLYYDAQSATNHVDNRYSQKRHGGQITNNRFVITPNVHSLGSQSDNGKSPNNNADDQFLAYVAFAREVALPSINIDVLPTPREMYKTIQNH